MSILFKAMTGFAIAFYIWSPANFAAHFDSKAISGLRAQIHDARPRDKLTAELTGLNR